MFGKILVPVDGSTAALKATNYAKGVAEKFESAVTLLHVIEHPGYLSSDTSNLPESVIQDMERNGKQILAEASVIFADFDGRFSTKLEYGHAGIKITELSKEHGYSLIVMGPRTKRSKTAINGQRQQLCSPLCTMSYINYKR